MITLAEPKMLKSNNMITLGLRFLLNTSQSLTPQRFQAFSQGDHLSVGFRLHNQAIFPKVIKCLSLSILVIIFVNEHSKSTWDWAVIDTDGKGGLKVRTRSS